MKAMSRGIISLLEAVAVPRGERAPLLQPVKTGCPRRRRVCVALPRHIKSATPTQC
jgi:hypothetical protein